MLKHINTTTIEINEFERMGIKLFVVGGVLTLTYSTGLKATTVIYASSQVYYLDNFAYYLEFD